MDEIVPTGTTWIAELKADKVRCFEITPEDAGVTRSSPEALKGGDAAHNADALRHVLAGKPSAFRDAAVMTAAAALIVAGRSETLAAAADLARASIDTGKAEQTLATLARISNS